MSQLSIEPVVNHGVSKKIEWWAGYTFGWPKCLGAYERWCSGVVVTPRYAERLKSELDRFDPHTPVILDNGAWPAFRDGKNLYIDEMLDQMDGAIELLGSHRIRFAIFPDDVGNPNTTTRRIERAFRRRNVNVRWLIPVQEGMRLRDVGAFGRMVGGVFIGGKTKGWKFRTAQSLRRYYPDLYLHCGRLSSEGELHRACQLGINSFDTTTFMMRMGSNQHTVNDLFTQTFTTTDEASMSIVTPSILACDYCPTRSETYGAPNLFPSPEMARAWGKANGWGHFILDRGDWGSFHRDLCPSCQEKETRTESSDSENRHE